MRRGLAGASTPSDLGERDAHGHVDFSRLESRAKQLINFIPVTLVPRRPAKHM